MANLVLNVTGRIVPNTITRRITGQINSLEDFLSGTTGDGRIRTFVRMTGLDTTMRAQYGVLLTAKAKVKPLMGEDSFYWKIASEKESAELEIAELQETDRMAILQQQMIKKFFGRVFYFTEYRSFYPDYDISR